MQRTRVGKKQTGSGRKRPVRFWALREPRLCAFCGSSHRVYLKRHIGIWDVLLAIALGFAMWVPWSAGGPEDAIRFFDPRGVAIGLVFIFGAEIFVVLRHRLSLNCPKCGFDPVTYRRQPEEAARRVREHLARRAEDPLLLLAEPVRLPKLRKKVSSAELSARARLEEKSASGENPQAPEPNASGSAREPSLNL
ncbi:MAG TPA: hypothetical protein PLZ57_10095 [Pseudobdellovibrionaceae bacterium]|nr:hypothetical protein [Pseudobdellovibrionaceae bacterium]